MKTATGKKLAFQKWGSEFVVLKLSYQVLGLFLPHFVWESQISWQARPARHLSGN
jgi:hypothetical protein